MHDKMALMRLTDIYPSALKIALITLYLACDYQVVAERIVTLGPSLMLLVFLGLYGLLANALIAAAFIPSNLARLVVGFCFAAASVTLHSYEWSTAAPLDYSSFETMLASSDDAADALAQHSATFIKAIAVSAILLVGVALPPRAPGLPASLHWIMPLAALLTLSTLLYMRGGEGSRALPAPFAPLAHASIKGALLLTQHNDPRKLVSFKPRQPRATTDIVLIVDESIAPMYLDINSPTGVSTGLTKEHPGLSIINYGIAAAVTNCSIGSNLTLRFGGTRESYRETHRSRPSIWAYAHAAGLRTVYLDGQRNRGKLQNMMSPSESALIDDFVQLDGTPVVARDHRLADLLAQRIANDVPEFIYVNKVGGHFPVADKFPDKAAHYLPIPERGRTNRIIDMGPAHGDHQGTSEEWRLYRNAYRNTLLWNVGGFFNRLLPHIDPNNAVIIYTADHGQDLHEGGHPGKATHCINDPKPEEGAVPLVVIDSTKSPRLDWLNHLHGKRNGASHFQIFPTLLELMGYLSSDYLALYGSSLAAQQVDEMTFTINYSAALGRAPTWREVKPRLLAPSPSSDYSASTLH